MRPSTNLALFLLALSILVSLTSADPVQAGPASTATTSAYNYRVLSGERVAVGEQRALVILVEFQDVRHSVSVDSIKSVAVHELNDYYSEVSYGRVSITGEVYGWYRVNHAISHYGRDATQPGEDVGLYSLAKDALALVPSSVDLDPFKFLVIVHAGKDQASGQNDVLSNEIWSQTHCGIFPDYGLTRPVTIRSKSFRCYTFLSEFDKVGTFAHEWGHLFGLPDLYDTDTGESYVGYWSLMDAGSFCCSAEGDSTPSYVGAWGASLLGWLAPSVAESDAIVTSFILNPLESPEASSILIPLSSWEYYFVEYREKSGQDSQLPSSGVLVSYVNESRDSGKGIVRLVDPENGRLFAPRVFPEGLDDAAFTIGGTFSDIINSVYLAFLSDQGVVTAIYSTQGLAESLLKSELKPFQFSFSGSYTERIQLTGTLTDEKGAPLASQTVQFEFLDSASGRWQPIANEITDQQGIVSFPLDLNYDVRDYQARFLYLGGTSGSVWYAASSTEFDILVRPAAMTVALSAPGTATTDNLPVEVFAASAVGHPLAGVSIAISVDNIQRGIVQTDTNGKAILILKLRAEEAGSHIITAETERANYLPAQASARVLTVPPPWMIALLIIAVVLVAVAFVRRGRTPPPALSSM